MQGHGLLVSDPTGPGSGYSFLRSLEITTSHIVGISYFGPALNHRKKFTTVEGKLTQVRVFLLVDIEYFGNLMIYNC